MERGPICESNSMTLDDQLKGSVGSDDKPCVSVRSGSILKN